ncbi:MAG: phosphoribosylanthranilate isomerase [Candidatus Promineifilaceae bacterium]|jgi:phosphoribosylanthranilate isomerase
MGVKVKICGITNLQDALVAVEAGADYLGFILFPPSKRSIPVGTLKTLVNQLRQRPYCPMLVGVFVNETLPTMAQILEDCRLDLAQLSGEEVPSMVADRQSILYGRAYKGIQPASQTEAEVEAEWYAVPNRPDHLPSLLVDTFHPTLRGGTGETGDWSVSALLAQQYPGLMLAGGLSAENVAEAVRRVRPFAVDVASGVESEPGKKDHDQVRSFIERAKDA